MDDGWDDIESLELDDDLFGQKENVHVAPNAPPPANALPSTTLPHQRGGAGVPPFKMKEEDTNGVDLQAPPPDSTPLSLAPNSQFSVSDFSLGLG